MKAFTRLTIASRCRGFTLIETLCAMAIAGVLSSVAYPSYQSGIAKARRADALVAMMQLQIAEERYRSANLSYGSVGDIGLPATSPAGHYTLAVTAPTSSGYTVLASATGVQSQDARCRFMAITTDGANVLYRSGADAALDNDATENRTCWNR